MKLRKRDRGIDFPYSREAAQSAQLGVEDERLRMDSILLDSLAVLAIRRALCQFPMVRDSIVQHILLEPDSIGDFVEVLKVARQDEARSPRSQTFDKAITKCREWQKKGLPIFVDV